MRAERKKLGRKARIIITLAAIAVVAVAAYFIYRGVVYTQMSEETAPRESWTTDTGTLLREDANSDVNIYQDDTLQALKSESDYSLEQPLAVWNSYGIGSNGLYLYFEAENAAQITYQIHTEAAGDMEATDYEATANAGTSDEKEFLMIGLVPGMENQVTICLLDESGTELQSQSFIITAPEAVYGYDVVLESENGESEESLTMRVLCATRCCWTVTKETGSSLTGRRCSAVWLPIRLEESIDWDG